MTGGQGERVRTPHAAAAQQPPFASPPWQQTCCVYQMPHRAQWGGKRHCAQGRQQQRTQRWLTRCEGWVMPLTCSDTPSNSVVRRCCAASAWNCSSSLPSLCSMSEGGRQPGREGGGGSGQRLGPGRPNASGCSETALSPAVHRRLACHPAPAHTTYSQAAKEPPWCCDTVPSAASFGGRAAPGAVGGSRAPRAWRDIAASWCRRGARAPLEGAGKAHRSAGERPVSLVCHTRLCGTLQGLCWRAVAWQVTAGCSDQRPMRPRELHLGGGGGGGGAEPGMLPILHTQFRAGRARLAA